ncbi:MAG: hypothetical protein CMM46_02315 [Rhodospirillaceae bacterium]|nr:hypothetical protein [Rhodospirillaceae bacterium]
MACVTAPGVWHNGQAMTDWKDLADELDRWGEAGRTATFWWRDDDAGPDDGCLEPFLDQRRTLDVPLALAVVPGWLTPRSVKAIGGDPGSWALQHGVNHTDRTTTERRKVELCRDALKVDLATLIDSSRDRLAADLGFSFLPVMVPPWNRIDAEITTLLPALGLRGLSTLGPRPASMEHGLALANVHIDIVNWKKGRCFVGDGPCLAAALDHLCQRRMGTVDPDEPTGLMTHHRVHDADCDGFVDRFVAFVRDHGVARWLDASHVFETKPAVT